MAQLDKFVDDFWDKDIVPSLLRYISIPCQTPASDDTWATNGLLDEAAQHLCGWVSQMLAPTKGATVEVLSLPGRTPLIFLTIPGEGKPILVYGHFDKQPPMDGWSNGRSAWYGQIEGDRLYGRGAADDGYSIYCAVGAIAALRESGRSNAPIAILIEGSEESGSGDLSAYFELLADRIGTPELIVALDAGALDYSAPWITTSVRGQVAGVLSVRTLSQAGHSGDLSGVTPSSFRIARSLLSRIEDERTGEVRPAEFHAPIPGEFTEQAKAASELIGNDALSDLPLASGVRPVSQDVSTILLNRAWRPQLTVTAIDGLPPIREAAPTMHPETVLKLSLRLPPSVDPQLASEALKKDLEADPPYGAQVRFDVEMESPGWHSRPLSASMANKVQKAAQQAFSKPAAFFGGGGGIPFLKMLGDTFPRADFLVTGVLGPGSNAHGPDEFLHLPTVKKLTLMLALLFADLASISAE